MNKYKIFLIIPTLKGGGAERVVLNIAKNLNQNKFNIYLIICCPGNDFKDEIPEYINVKELNYKHVYQSIPKLALLITKEKPDLIFSALSHMNLATIISNIISPVKTKVIISEHNTYSFNSGMKNKNKLKNFLMAKFINYLYNHSKRIIFVSYGSLNDFKTIFKKIDYNKAIVIYNPIVYDNINILKQEDVGIKEKYILSVGRLTKQKGYEYLLKAFKLVYEQNENIRLIILGQGEDKEKLIEYCKELNIHDVVYFLGFQENPYKYMANSEVFVLSSLWEGFGNVLVEAMACGVPVISTNCPSGPSEIIFDKINGILVPPKNPIALADAIINILNNKEYATSLAKKGLERAQDFHVKKIIKEYERLFIEVFQE